MEGTDGVIRRGRWRTCKTVNIPAKPREKTVGQKRPAPEALEASTSDAQTVRQSDLDASISRNKRLKQETELQARGCLELPVVGEGELVFTSDAMEVRKMWETVFPAPVRCIAWDNQDNCWWILSGFVTMDLFKYGEHGEMQLRITKGLSQRSGGVAVDTRRNCLVVGDYDSGLVRFSKDGQVKDNFTLKQRREIGVMDIVYCPKTDCYIIVDFLGDCLVIVDAATGNRKQIVGKRGSSNRQFKFPQSIYHRMGGNGDCRIVVCDRCNDAIKLYTCGGQFIDVIDTEDAPSRVPEENHVQGKNSSFLGGPWGACSDPDGTVFMCDRTKRSITYYEGEQGSNAGWNFITSTGERQPFRLSISFDGKYLASSTIDNDGLFSAEDRGLLTMYMITRKEQSS